MGQHTTGKNMEIWKDIPGYGGHYQASNFGNIRTKERVVVRKHPSGEEKKFYYKPRMLRLSDCGPYKSVHIGIDGKKYNIQVGRLVLMAFNGLPADGMECCHNDGNGKNNNILNLRWDTHANNNRDRVKHGTYKTGSDHHFSKFSNDIKNKIASGKISKKEALKLGVSNTHFYRILSSKKVKYAH